MIEIIAVDSGSIAEELELESGDRLLSINGEPVRDLIDALRLSEGEQLLLEIEKADGELWDLEIDKDAEMPLGWHFPHPEPTQCGNNCLFCFVHQLPRGMRKTLYVKDEDYRFSYLYGSYVTLTNIGEEEIRRIIDQRLSPLYVSVHATDDHLRDRLLGRKSPSILELLRRLTEAGIRLHTQIVLCPGINDGLQLQRTVEDLYALAPGIESLAVVPVGLTGYRSRLPELRPPTPAEAREVLDFLHECQVRFRKEGGSHFVFAADELYLKAERDFPPLDDYEDLSQLENGVGMIPLFREQAEEVLREAGPLQSPPVTVFSGESFYPELKSFAERLGARTGVSIGVHAVVNDFFGGFVTVAGLLTGTDIIGQLRGKDLGEVLLVPDVVLREGEAVFLDDMTLEDLGKELGVRVMLIDSSPFGLLAALEDLDDERRGYDG